MDYVRVLGFGLELALSRESTRAMGHGVEAVVAQQGQATKGFGLEAVVAQQGQSARGFGVEAIVSTDGIGIRGFGASVAYFGEVTAVRGFGVGVAMSLAEGTQVLGLGASAVYQFGDPVQQVLGFGCAVVWEFEVVPPFVPDVDTEQGCWGPVPTVDPMAGRRTRPLPRITATYSDYGTWVLGGLWHTTPHRQLNKDVLLFGMGETGYTTWGTPPNYQGTLYDMSSTTPNVDVDMVEGDLFVYWLEWYQLARLDYDAGEDNAVIEVLVGGVVTHTFTKDEVVGTSLNTDWDVKRLDVTPHVNGQTQVQFRYRITTNIAHPTTDEGWYISDARLLLDCRE